MKKFGFCEKFASWIRKCVETVSFSVLANNGPAEIVRPKRGLRQGDPLSPILFIIGAEILARKLLSEANCPIGGLGFPLVRGGAKVRFLSFTNDIMIFDKAN